MKPLFIAFLLVVFALFSIGNSIPVFALSQYSVYNRPSSITQRSFTWNKILPQQKVIEVSTTPLIESEVEIKSVKKNTSTPFLSIPKIGLQQVSLGYASIGNINDLDQKMLYQPIVESILSADACTPGRNTYITGHSEPSYASIANYPAVNIFTNLNKLVAGDVLQISGKNGKSCSYKVTQWETVATTNEDQVPQTVFDNLYNPDTNGKSMLSIQTCKKGSATIRLILRAEMVLS